MHNGYILHFWPIRKWLIPAKTETENTPSPLKAENNPPPKTESENAPLPRKIPPISYQCSLPNWGIYKSFHTSYWPKNVIG